MTRRLCWLFLGILSACAGPHLPPASDFGTPTRLTCVPYARQVSGIQLSGDAYAWWDESYGLYPRGQRPEPGAVLVFKPHGSMTAGHLAVVTEVQDPRDILVTQSNWLPHRIEQNQPVVDISAANDWTLVRVWYEPAAALGITAYPTDGFIYPR